MRRIAFGALWAAIATETWWIVAKIIRQHGSLGGVTYGACVTVAFIGLAATRGRYRWMASILRMFIGVAFLGSVCDRLGIFGAPGTPGVSWGNIGNFTTYTGQVNSFLPAAAIPALAVIESVIEGVLGLGLLIGVWLRVTVWASSVLLGLFAFAMTVSLGITSQFPFAVFVLATGGWVLTTTDASFLSSDTLLVRSRAQRTLPRTNRQTEH